MELRICGICGARGEYSSIPLVVHRPKRYQEEFDLCSTCTGKIAGFVQGLRLSELAALNAVQRQWKLPETGEKRITDSFAEAPCSHRALELRDQASVRCKKCGAQWDRSEDVAGIILTRRQ